MIFARLRRSTELLPQTFTYFIPPPPPRKTGYRERAFDHLFSQIASEGGKNFKLTAQSINGHTQGMWILIYYECTPQQAILIEQALEKKLQSLFCETDTQSQRYLNLNDPDDSKCPTTSQP